MELQINLFNITRFVNEIRRAYNTLYIISMYGESTRSTYTNIVPYIVYACCVCVRACVCVRVFVRGGGVCDRHVFANSLRRSIACVCEKVDCAYVVPCYFFYKYSSAGATEGHMKIT